MPTTHVRIRQVFSSPTRLQGVTQHVIYVEPVDLQEPRALGLATVQTVNDWRASLCQQALKQDQIVALVWRDSQFGPEVLAVESVGAKTA